MVHWMLIFGHWCPVIGVWSLGAMPVGWWPSVWFHSPHCHYVSACLPLWHSNDSVHGCNGEGASVKIACFYSGVMRRMQPVDVACGLIIACNGAEITSVGFKSFQTICCSRHSLKLPHCIFFFFLSGQSRSHSSNSISKAQFYQDHMLNIMFRTFRKFLEFFASEWLMCSPAGCHLHCKLRQLV